MICCTNFPLASWPIRRTTSSVRHAIRLIIFCPTTQHELSSGQQTKGLRKSHSQSRTIQCCRKLSSRRFGLSPSLPTRQLRKMLASTSTNSTRKPKSNPHSRRAQHQSMHWQSVPHTYSQHRQTRRWFTYTREIEGTRKL